MDPFSDHALGTFPRDLGPNDAPKTAFMLISGHQWVTTGHSCALLAHTDAVNATTALLLLRYYYYVNVTALRLRMRLLHCYCITLALRITIAAVVTIAHS